MESDGSSHEPLAKGAVTPPTTSGGEGPPPSTSPKKRRKVNHACIYCRRSHMTCDLDRPCTRCVKRNIGHLCHDEPREPVRRSKSDHNHAHGNEEASVKQEDVPTARMAPPLDQQQPGQQLLQEAGLNMNAPAVSVSNQANTPLAQPAPVSGANANVLGNSGSHFSSYNDWGLGGHNQFQDMHTFHPSYMFNAPEVTHEYNLLNDFLSTSLLDDGAMFPGDDSQSLYADPSLINTVATGTNGSKGQYLANSQQNQLLAANQDPSQGNVISRPTSTLPIDKARETYYMTAADPAGSDTPEERMNKLLRAKYDAGMLRPFNYVKGYARLNQYMEQHMRPASRQKILRQLDRFRPKFRERMQTLTDIELVFVEMWFERSLMEYDRVFASMAVPACCWRRTGEIFRGNKEMAELIHVPIEKLRDVKSPRLPTIQINPMLILKQGKLAIHEIILEDQLVSYWEKFGAIAFDNSQKAMLTSCSLKNPDLNSADPGIQCCFSFTIRRDTHNIPSLIVGNFLPTNPTKK